MHVKIVISTVGKDQPGLVSKMCQAIAEADGNIDDSTMTRLGGQFSMIFIVELHSEERLSQFTTHCKALESQGLFHVDIQRLDENAVSSPLADAETPPSSRKYLLSVGGYDRTGITHAFSEALASFNINITDVNAHRINGEAGIVYMLAIEMDVPLDVEDAEMKARLEALGQKMNLDVRLRSMDAIIL